MDLLKKLGIQLYNSGASFSAGWWSTSKQDVLVSVNPATLDEIASVYCCTAADYEQVVTAAQQSFLTWREVPAPKRAEVVRQLALLLREYKSALGSLIALEMGKSKQEGDGEVQEMIDIADFAIGQARMLYGYTMPSERPQHRLYEQWHPLGPIGVITAFNFPMAVWAWNAMLAAVCGNTVIWKPSSAVPLCAIAVQHLCNKVMADNGYQAVFSLLIPPNNHLAETLVADKRLPLISFTGSTATGRHVAEQVARRLGRCLLELGGNNAIIVDETADLQLAIPAIMFGAIGTAGQRCTTTRRLIVHESIYEQLLSSLINAYRQLKVGDPLDEHNHMGPLINERAVKMYLDAIAQAQAQGGTIEYGGNALPGKGYFVEPTIISISPEVPIVQQETFAPILYVMRYRSLTEAVAMQNAVSQGLSSAIFSMSMRHAEYFLSASGSDCGIANVNIGTSGAEIGGAFGGEKDTGGGREAGSDAWKAYMRRQTVTINWGNRLPLAQGIKFDL